MSLSEYRASPSELQRTDDLLKLMPESGIIAIDIGARDGHFSVLMTKRYEQVVALDLTQPQIFHPQVQCVEGDATQLEYNDNYFDLVFCSEVLEHIPSDLLTKACSELERVSKQHLLIGVPYRQDLRVGRTTCYTCMKPNPPWGHVNAFDEKRLAALFPNCTVEATSYVSTNKESTNALASKLMDWAGNPYGTYVQEECCIHCGEKLKQPPPRSFVQKVLTKLAFWTQNLTQRYHKPHPNWIHVLLVKNNTAQ